MKSNVSDYLEVMHAVYIDACMKCSADVSDLRDLETIRSRVKDEGISFLTITLPKFCQDFDKSLEFGIIDSTAFRSFRKVGSIPAFLQGMTSRIFDRETGRMRSNELPQANGVFDNVFLDTIESVRQICLTFKKIEIECTPERVQSALSSFASIEQSFDEFSVPKEEYDRFANVSLVLWADLVRTIVLTDLIPRHGPGATAERISGNRKYCWQRWHERLEPYFPIIENGYPLGIPPDSRELELVTFVPREQEQPVRVVPVPKTLKSPRIIAIEPCCMQYAQQAIRDELYVRIERHWRTSGHVNFTDQSVNQKLALMSSLDGQFATIDLSDASDRVPRDLALDMFNGNPDLKDAIDACRSTMAQLPDGTLIGPLRKFASMGSALCFPVEAMYFYTICIVALLQAQNLPETTSNVNLVAKLVYVYGDDIVVPSAYADVVLDYLQKYNCKVNTNKTFRSGSFRESCGVDAFAGYEVTPTYLRQECPENKQQSSRILSWVATANLFYKRGYWTTAQLLFNKVEQLIGPLPYVSDDSELLGRISFVSRKTLSLWNQRFQKVRWNSDVQRLEIKGLVARPIYRTDKLDGYAALTKCFIHLEGKPDFGNPSVNGVSASLERTALYGAVTLKHRWAHPE